jgi:hypothetical protein
MPAQAPQRQPYMDERWFLLLTQAVQDDPRGKAGVALRLQAAGAEKVGRTQLSLILNGHYPASTRLLAAKVLSLLDRHPCPYLGAEVAIEHCIAINAGPAPTWDPAALDQRRCCQTCPHQPRTPNEGEKA